MSRSIKENRYRGLKANGSQLTANKEVLRTLSFVCNAGMKYWDCQDLLCKDLKKEKKKLFKVI